MALDSSIVFLPVTDIEKTLEFYRDVLGLKVPQKQGDNLYIFDTGYGYWGFCQYGDGRKPLSGPRGVCISLNLSSNEEVMERYQQLKDSVSIYRKPERHPVFPVYSFFISDPDGYLVEYQKIAEE